MKRRIRKLSWATRPDTLFILLVTCISSVANASLAPPQPPQTRPSFHIPFCTPIFSHDIPDLKYFTSTSSGSVFVDDRGRIYHSFARKDRGKARPYDIKETLVETFPGNPKAKDRAVTMLNAFTGNVQEQWKRNSPTYRTIDYGEIYPNIAMNLVTSPDGVEKVFTVRPGGNPGDIRIRVEGTGSVKLGEGGKIFVRSGSGVFTISRPLGYQVIEGRRKHVDVSYVLDGDTYGFRVKNYDTSKDLVIDPVISSTYFDRPEKLEVAAIQVDSNGNVFVAGTVDFSNNLSNDAFVAKFNPGLTSLLAFSYLSGSLPDGAVDIALDQIGNVYVAGWTSSPDFPVTSSVMDNTLNGPNDVFVAKFDNSLSTLIASTYVGGNSGESVNSIRLDSTGNVYISGGTDSIDFPIAAGAYDKTFQGSAFYVGDYGELYITKLDSSLTNVLASTYLGGSKGEQIVSMIIDTSGNIFVAGKTASPDFPVKFNAYDNSMVATRRNFISKLDGGLGALLASTFLDVDIGSIAYDGDINIYVAGSAPDFSTFPITATNLYTGGFRDAIVAKLDGNLTRLIASFRIGGAQDDNGKYVQVGTNGNIYMIGEALSLDYPTLTGTSGGDGDAIISVFDGNLTKLLSSTYLGGNGMDSPTSFALDPAGNIIIAGHTESSNFPVSVGAYSTTYTAPWDAFVSVISSNAVIGPQVPNVKAFPDFDTRILTIYNLGAADLRISGIQLSNVHPQIFSLNANGGSHPCGSASPTIPAGGNCTIIIAFNVACADVPNKYSNFVIIDSNDPDSPTLNIGFGGVSPVCASVPSGGGGGGCAMIRFGNELTDPGSAMGTCFLLVLAALYRLFVWGRKNRN